MWIHVPSVSMEVPAQTEGAVRAGSWLTWIPCDTVDKVEHTAVSAPNRKPIRDPRCVLLTFYKLSKNLE